MTQALALQSREQEPITQTMRSWQPPDATGALTRDIATIHARATISAGEAEEYFNERTKRQEFRPKRSSKIVLHDEDNPAPGLRAALEETNYESLTIGFGWNDPNMIVRQRVASYIKSPTRAGAGSLSIVGDNRKLVVFENGGSREVFPNEKEFAKLWAQCRTETWVYFYLAGFDHESGQPYLWFPDNVAIPYRLRFGGINSHRNLEACLQSLHPQYAIMPISLTLDPEFPLIRPGGVRGKGPVWQFAPLLPPVPGGVKIRMDSRRLLELRQGAYQQTTALALPVPDIENVTRAVYSEGPTGENYSDEQTALMLRGGPCDATKWRRIWFKLVKDTPADNDNARHRFVRWFTAQHEEMWQTEHLQDFLEHATNKDASELVCAVLDLIERRSVQTQKGAINTETGEVTESQHETEPSNSSVDQNPQHTDTPDSIHAELPETVDPGDMGEGGWGEDDEQVSDLAESIDEQESLRWLQRLSDAYDAFPDAQERKATTADRTWLLGVLREVGGSDDAYRQLLEALTSKTTLRDLGYAHFQVLRAEVSTPSWRDNMTRLMRSLQLSEARPA